MPGYGGMRLLIDGGFTPSFNEGAMLLVALGWTTVLMCAVLNRHGCDAASFPVKEGCRHGEALHTRGEGSGGSAGA